MLNISTFFTKLIFLNFFVGDNLYILFFLVFLLLFSYFLFYLGFILVGILPIYYRIDMYAYECGFDPWEDSRVIFDVRFYLVGLLFLIFDVEILYLFPLSICIGILPIVLTVNEFVCIFIIIVLLSLGFFFESGLGILDW